MYKPFYNLFQSEMQTYSEEVTNIVKSAVMAAAVGMMYGGLPAARAARERFIQQSQAEVFRHRVEAVVSSVGHVCTPTMYQSIVI